MQLRADDFGCVPDGRVLDKVAVLAGSSQLDVLDDTLRPGDVGQHICVPGGTELTTTIAKLVGASHCKATMDAGHDELTTGLPSGQLSVFEHSLVRCFSGPSAGRVNVRCGLTGPLASTGSPGTPAQRQGDRSLRADKRYAPTASLISRAAAAVTRGRLNLAIWPQARPHSQRRPPPGVRILRWALTGRPRRHARKQV
jgi:hypothetical protein